MSASPAASSACAAGWRRTRSRMASRSGAPIPKARTATLLVDPQKTTALGKPIGADSSLKSWEGDQWKIGGGDTWGWMAYDPELNLIYYGSGNPSTWNPVQRPGDNKWSMTIFARDPDTGMAKWVYQMTPHDQWDYDGVNEMILADQQINGATVPTLVHFDRNGFGYTLNRETGELLVAAKYDPAVNWTTGVDMDKNSANYGRPVVVAKYSPAGRLGRELSRDLPGGVGEQGRAAGGLFARYRVVLRAHKPCLHGLRAVPRLLHRGAALCRRHADNVSRHPASTNMGNFIAWDAPRARSCGRIRSNSRYGPARSRPPAGWCSTARWRAI